MGVIMTNVDFKNITKDWLDFGSLDSNVKKFDDLVIPRRYSMEMQHGFFFQKDNILYHFKVLNLKKYYIRELLGELVSESLSIPTIKCNLARIKMNNKDFFGLVSEWARNPSYSYFSIEKFRSQLDVSKNPLKILDVLEDNYPNSIINQEFRNFLARDYFAHELDRKEDEITFQSKNQEVSFGYLCDYEFEFYKINQLIGIENYYKMDLENESIKRRVLSDDRLMESFRKVLKINFLNLLEQLETQKKINITKEEKDNLLEFQLNSQKEIRRVLSL